MIIYRRVSFKILVYCLEFKRIPEVDIFESFDHKDIHFCYLLTIFIRNKSRLIKPGRI